MTEHDAKAGRGHGAAHESSAVEVFDREIDVRGIVVVGVWLAVITIAAFGASWLFYRGLSSHERKTLDSAPSPMREANLPRPPAGPLLQASPEGELAAFRRAEQAKLTSWGWVDPAHTVAHVPVERAIDAVAGKGLPNFSSPAPAAEGTP